MLVCCFFCSSCLFYCVCNGRRLHPVFDFWVASCFLLLDSWVWVGLWVSLFCNSFSLNSLVVSLHSLLPSFLSSDLESVLELRFGEINPVDTRGFWNAPESVDKAFKGVLVKPHFVFLDCFSWVIKGSRWFILHGWVGNCGITGPKVKTT